jgi:hypothetical protein
VGDAGALSVAIGRVLNDPDLAASMSHSGRTLAEAGHGIDGFADDLAALYRRLCGQAPTVVGAGLDR